MEIETYIIINMSCFDMIIILLIRAKLFLVFGIKLLILLPMAYLGQENNV